MVKRSYYTAFQHPVVAHNVYRKCPCRPAGNAQESADSGVHKICDVAKPQTLADVLVKRVLGTLKKEVANRISSACYNERERMPYQCSVALQAITSLNYGLLTQGSWMRPSTKTRSRSWQVTWFGSWQVTWFGS